MSVEYINDNEVENAGKFIIENEDHTLGNIIRTSLLLNKHVIFAGYRIEHPLSNKLYINIRTDVTISPKEALNNSIDDLINELDELNNLIIQK